MKTRLLISFLFLTSFSIMAQHSTVLHNVGPMYIGGNTTNANNVAPAYSSILIKGSATFDDGSAVATNKLSVMSITGDFVSSIADNAPEQHVFTTFKKNKSDQPDPLMGVDGYMWFVNKEQYPVEVPRAFNRGGEAFELSLTKKQSVKMLSSRKDLHFISMPTIYGSSVKDELGVDLVGTYIAFDPSVSVASPIVKPSVKGIVSIEGKYADNRRLDIAYVKSALLPNEGGNPDGDISSWTNTTGEVIRDIRLYDPTAVGAGGNSNLLVDNGTNDKTYMLTGFTPMSPYLYADHMFFNVLTRPQNGSFTGWEGPIVDPTYEMKGGYGYFIAQDAVPFSDPIYSEIVDRHSVDSEERAVGGYILGGREVFMNKITGQSGKENFNRFTKTGTKYSTAARPYIGESLGGANETFEDMLKSGYGAPFTVKLNAGMNFLGNPFTAPLDLSDFTAVAPGAVGQLDQAWGTTDGGQSFTISPDLQADIRGTFWVVNGATLRYFDRDGRKMFQYKANYWDAQKEGGTIDLGSTSNYTVGPMQMFTLQTSKPLTLTLPVSKTVMSNVKTTRSAVVRSNELLLQTVVLGDNDEELSEDRLAIVLKNNGSMSGTDAFDSRKLLTNTQEGNDGEDVVLKNGNGNDTRPFSGMVYTKSFEGVPLSTSVLPNSIHQVAMYFEPTQEERRVRIKPYRFETWNDIENVWLEDRFANKIIELTPETEYVFTSSPLTSELAKENRFVIHFNKQSIDEESTLVDENIGITTYYNGSVLYVDGLQQQDINSILYIYDLQGRLIGQTKINSAPSMHYVKSLLQGTYIAKITGERNFTTKFTNL